MGAPHKLRDYYRNYPDTAGPPRRLDEWIKAWEEGIENYDHLADDKALHQRSNLRKSIR
jgi:hypothetical protein